ncbi:hypothetical protein HUT18_23285 [Streptomyces sp. NA04227]|uniref:hypothetical protein n=1 Tax=Streptomyces sp. NA04227 TaxID=2742136 RepID=UPI00158FBF50|nr:hypothetical protein [Streptomyces sp. NA04227]QKW08866.1 hypothetical protein HUT18_23285 [Streptomyces sp. NA04227]
MPTAVAVTSADLVLPSLDRHTPSAAVLQSAVQAPRSGAVAGLTKGSGGAHGRGQQGGGEFSLDRLLAEVSTLLDHHGHVIVLCPASAPQPVLHRLHTVRSVLETDRIALLRPALPPLGLAVLALQLRQLSVCDFSPGVLASAARLLTHYIYAGAVLGSVTKLDRVPVSLGSHARSWVPGSQFAVLATPEPQLLRLTGQKPQAQAAPKGPAFGTRLLVAPGQLDADWLTSTLAPAWQVQDVTHTRQPAESAEWWGTAKLAEFAAAIGDISVLYQLVSSVRRDRCHWCGLELIGDRCGFCAAPLPPPPELTASAARALPTGVG